MGIILSEDVPEEEKERLKKENPDVDIRFEDTSKLEPEDEIVGA